AIFLLILSTLMIPTEMLVIPWYVMSARNGWLNTYWGIAFPGLIPAFGVFLMRQFFATLPRDLFDAGRVDGVSEFGLFWRIGLPLVGPGLAALGIFNFVGNWNAFLWPLIAAQSPSMRTIPVGVALFSGEAGTAWNLIMAASALAIVPVLLVFFLFQRQIIEGVVLTGVKGGGAGAVATVGRASSGSRPAGSRRSVARQLAQARLRDEVGDPGVVRLDRQRRHDEVLRRHPDDRGVRPQAGQQAVVVAHAVADAVPARDEGQPRQQRHVERLGRDLGGRGRRLRLAVAVPLEGRAAREPVERDYPSRAGARRGH